MWGFVFLRDGTKFETDLGIINRGIVFKAELSGATAVVHATNSERQGEEKLHSTK